MELFWLSQIAASIPHLSLTLDPLGGNNTTSIRPFGWISGLYQRTISNRSSMAEADSSGADYKGSAFNDETPIGEDVPVKVHIIAPSTLPEGYSFEAEVGAPGAKKTITVEVVSILYEWGAYTYVCLFACHRSLTCCKYHSHKEVLSRDKHSSSHSPMTLPSANHASMHPPADGRMVHSTYSKQDSATPACGAPYALHKLPWHK